MVRDPTGAKLLLSPSDLPRHKSSINDNYCVVTGAVKDLNYGPVTGKDCHCMNLSLKTRTLSPVYCHVANHVPFAGGLPQKKGVNPDHQRVIKSERCFLCKSLKFCTKCHKCPTCCTKSTCRGQITPVLGKIGSPRHQPQSTSSPQRRLHTSLPVPAQSDKKAHNNKLLCKSSQEQLPVVGIASTVRQKCCRIGPESTVPGLLQPVISGTQTQQPVATYLRPEHTEQLFENTIVQNEDPKDYKDFPPGRGVGDVHRFQRHILPYTNKQPVQEVHALSCPGQDLSIQSTALWSVHSPHGVCSGGQRGQISDNEKGYKNPPVPR